MAFAWTYSDYITYGRTAAGLERARLHHQEITDAITANLSDQGKSRQSDHLVTLREQLEKWIDATETKLGVSGSGPTIMHADFRGSVR